MAALKYRYKGWEAGYLFNLEPGDITVEQWAALPAAVQADVAAAPHVYELVATATPAEADQFGPVVADAPVLSEPPAPAELAAG